MKNSNIPKILGKIHTHSPNRIEVRTIDLIRLSNDIVEHYFTLTAKIRVFRYFTDISDAASCCYCCLCYGCRLDGIGISEKYSTIKFTITSEFPRIESRWPNKTTISATDSTTTTVVHHTTRLSQFWSTSQYSLQSRSNGHSAIINTTKWLHHFSESKRTAGRRLGTQIIQKFQLETK